MVDIFKEKEYFIDTIIIAKEIDNSDISEKQALEDKLI